MAPRRSASGNARSSNARAGSAVSETSDSGRSSDSSSSSGGGSSGSGSSGTARSRPSDVSGRPRHESGLSNDGRRMSGGERASSRSGNSGSMLSVTSDRSGMRPRASGDTGDGTRKSGSASTGSRNTRSGTASSISSVPSGRSARDEARTSGSGSTRSRSTKSDSAISATSGQSGMTSVNSGAPSDKSRRSTGASANGASRHSVSTRDTRLSGKSDVEMADHSNASYLHRSSKALEEKDGDAYAKKNSGASATDVEANRPKDSRRSRDSRSPRSEGKADSDKLSKSSIGSGAIKKSSVVLKAIALGVDQRFMADLQGMTLRELKKRARAMGVSQDALDDIDSQDDPQNALIQLILVEKATTREVEPRLLAELEAMTLKDLKQRARGMGVSQDTLEDMDDQDDPKKAVIQLVLVQKARDTLIVEEGIKKGVVESGQSGTKRVARWNQNQKEEHDRTLATAVIEIRHEERPERRRSQLKKSAGNHANEAQKQWNARQKEEMAVRGSVFAAQFMAEQVEQQNNATTRSQSPRAAPGKAVLAKDLWNLRQKSASATAKSQISKGRRSMAMREATQVRALLAHLRKHRTPDEIDKASMKITALLLGRRYRRQFQRRKRAVVFIQLWWRRNRLRAKARSADFDPTWQSRKRAAIAATRIQAVFRGRKARKRAHDIRHFAHLDDKLARDKALLKKQQERAVLKERLQAMGMVQADYQKSNTADEPQNWDLEMKIKEKIAAVYRALDRNEAVETEIKVKERQEEVEREHHAAIAIQRRFRGIMGRREADRRRRAKYAQDMRAEMKRREVLQRKEEYARQKREAAAAAKIRDCFRRMKARKELKALRAEKERRERQQRHEQVLRFERERAKKEEHRAAKAREMIELEDRAQKDSAAEEERDRIRRVERFRYDQKVAKEQREWDRWRTKMEAVYSDPVERAEFSRRLVFLRKENWAALKIQRAWRRKMNRRAMQKKLKWKKERDLITKRLQQVEDAEAAKRAKAALTIQRSLRGKMARREVRVLKERKAWKTQQQLQGKLIEKLGKEEQRTRQQAASKIQAVFRGRAVRKLQSDLNRAARRNRLQNDLHTVSAEMAALTSQLEFRYRKVQAKEAAAESPTVNLKALERALPSKVLKQADVGEAMAALKLALKENLTPSRTKGLASKVGSSKEMPPASPMLRARTPRMNNSPGEPARNSRTPRSGLSLGASNSAPQLVHNIKPRTADAAMAALRVPSAPSFELDRFRGVPPPQKAQNSSHSHGGRGTPPPSTVAGAKERRLGSAGALPPRQLQPEPIWLLNPTRV